ncbi:MAG: methylenetetrahydrofolate reductase [Nocardioidaceae bacterium]|nr:methylenetetrahydrofolate reductase [Nocardioidaceae bacterium]
MTDSRTSRAASSSSGEHRRRDALAAALRRPRVEVLPLAGTAELVEQHVPHELPVTVTASPRHGLEPTLVLTEALARVGFSAVPHLAARLVFDDAHLTEILHRLEVAGVGDVFVVAGDGERPVGDFTDSLELLTAMQRLRESGVARGLDQVGVAGYPEGHPLISHEDLMRALHAKQPLSTYVVTQMCFDAKAVSSWVTGARQSGMHLPVHVGVAGAVDQRKLLRIVGRIGIGQSARFLRKHRHGLVRLLRPGGYRPDHVVLRLAADMAEPERRMAGLHLYTLGDVAATERWRQQMLWMLRENEIGHG